PRFVKQYARVGEIMLDSFKRFKEEVEGGTFPGEEHSFKIEPEEFERV
ncbi:MAG: 3-methyl-2-oxobutanoate hydroxymethyltransferase, partial [Deltaproteobacteria bacterium]|nr:3-methyl-2-oxobutanoate hydroxymethyltransferase [Deltaproteobacteria bacterium]